VLFNSLTFLVFFACAFVVHQLLRSWVARKRWLLLASYVFYAAWYPAYVTILIFSTTLDWWLGLRISAATEPSRRRTLLIVSVAANLLLLGFFKYGGFVLSNIEEILSAFGVSGHVPAWNVLLPIGISFYTFASLSYTIDVYRGEILVLLGGSGSGKSTLLKHVLGLAKPDAGSVTINGVDITSCSPSELGAVRRRIGVAFQAAALFNSLSVEENVALPLRELTRLADSTIKLTVWMKLMAVGLSDAGSLYPPELSGGMRKRAAVARAMALDPEILILDEPSAGLDPIVSAGLDELILFLNRSFGITILVVTHELESAFQIADRIAMLYRGRLIAADTKEQFAGNAHPRIRQFLDRQPDAAPGAAAEEFIASYIRGSKDDN